MNKIRMYGLSGIMGFPCLCIGRKAIFCKIGWSRKKKRPVAYTGIVTTEEVLRNMDNGCKRFRFFGFMKIRGYHLTIEQIGGEMNNSAFSQQQRTQISNAFERVQSAININNSTLAKQQDI